MEPAFFMLQTSLNQTFTVLIGDYAQHVVGHDAVHDLFDRFFVRAAKRGVRGKDFRPAVAPARVGVEDAAGQLDELADVTDEQRGGEARFRRTFHVSGRLSGSE